MSHRMRPITPVRTFEHVIDQIVDSIGLGELNVGDRIPSERELAVGMGISRPTLREAIRALVDLGVLEVRRDSPPGVYVKSTHLPRELLRSRVELSANEVRSVLEARRMLEPRVALLAAARGTTEDFDRMQATIDAQKAMIADGTVVSDPDHFAVHDVHFHMRMGAATHNSTIILLMKTLQGRLEFARDLVQHEHDIPEWVIDIHERTLSAIMKADHDLIEAVMEEHIRELELAWERSSRSTLVRRLPDFMVPAEERGAGEADLGAPAARE